VEKIEESLILMSNCCRAQFTFITSLVLSKTDSECIFFCIIRRKYFIVHYAGKKFESEKGWKRWSLRAISVPKSMAQHLGLDRPG
jgi:hypothetical protein